MRALDEKNAYQQCEIILYYCIMYKLHTHITVVMSHEPIIIPEIMTAVKGT